jgi:hypothetical protein
MHGDILRVCHVFERGVTEGSAISAISFTAKRSRAHIATWRENSQKPLQTKVCKKTHKNLWFAEVFVRFLSISRYGSIGLISWLMLDQLAQTS